MTLAPRAGRGCRAAAGEGPLIRPSATFSPRDGEKGNGARAFCFAFALSIIALAAPARVFMTQQQALASAFPSGVKVTRQAIFLTTEQRNAARKESGIEFDDKLIVRYAGANGSFAYFDTHRVRTLPETVMIVVNAKNEIEKIEVLSFDEPPEYLPKERWFEQFEGRRLDDDLSLKRKIRPISGASLSGRAILNASRKVLALHKAIGSK